MAWQRRPTSGENSLSNAAIALVLISAFIHASWNIMARRGRAETRFIGRMLPFVAIVGFVPGFVGQLLTGSLRGEIWLYVASSGFCCGFYFLSLGRAYESADFTTVYPVARSLPVLLVAFGDALRGSMPTGAGWLGMALVVAGCVIAPARSPREVAPRLYWNRASLWMVLTALGTVGYSLLDKRASELLAPGPLSAAIYCYFFYFFTFLGYLPLATAFRRRGGGMRDTSPLWLPATAGTLSALGYFLVLWSYQLVARASYVVAFRQASLVIAVLMAFALYREERNYMRLGAVLVITFGLVLIKLFG